MNYFVSEYFVCDEADFFLPNLWSHISQCSFFNKTF